MSVCSNTTLFRSSIKRRSTFSKSRGQLYQRSYVWNYMYSVHICLHIFFLKPEKIILCECGEIRHRHSLESTLSCMSSAADSFTVAKDGRGKKCQINHCFPIFLVLQNASHLNLCNLQTPSWEILNTFNWSNYPQQHSESHFQSSVWLSQQSCPHAFMEN